MTKAKPLLSDIQLTRIKFNPGDRVLARVSSNLSSEQYKKLERSIIKFAREDVRVLIVNCMEIRMVRLRLGEDPYRMAGPEDMQSQPIDLGVANLRCSVTEFEPDDQLVITIPRLALESQKRQLHKFVQEWTGKDVEIRIEEGLF